VSQSQIPVAGIKPLYLFSAGGGAPGPISRSITGNTSNITIAAAPSVQTWTQDVAMQLPMTLNPSSNNVPINLYMSCTNGRTGNVKVDLTCGAISLTQTKSITFAAGGTIYLQTFNLPYTSPQTCSPGNKWTLTITNSGINRALTVYPVNGVNRSSANLPSATVINVDSVNAYSAPYPATSIPASGYYASGQTVYVRTAVSDPFGSFDISSATISIKDPNNTIVSAATLTNIVTATTGTNTYEYAFTVPATSLIGYWTVNVTANEGTEGTISDLGTGTFRVGSLPNIMVLKSVQVISDPISGATTTAKAIPGAVLEYTVTVTNSGTGVADGSSLVVTDPIPSNTTMYVSTVSGDPVLFTCSTSPACGLTFTYGSDVKYTNTYPLPAVQAPPNACGNFTYAPTGNYDANVKGLCINPEGTLNGGNANFTVKFRVQLN
jgi:uncharacterized repeat protein (TIGR01451 family)